jgi:SAM-dependent methyltransferase
MSQHPPSHPWRNRLKKVPGLAPAVRRARSAWSYLRNTGEDTFWRVRALFLSRGGARVAQVWGDDAATRWTRAPRDWTDSDAIIWAHVFPLFDGVDWYEYLHRHYCREPRAAALSLCCGSGYVERDFVRRGLVATCEGIDISPSAVELARREAHLAGLSDRLTYRVADIETEALQPDSYDLVIAWMALHHLRRLRHVFRQVQRTLRPGGIFVINEYVGPSRFQLPRRQVARINNLLAELPPALRRTIDGSVKELYRPPRLSQIIRHDPSEAVRSDRIIPYLRRTFDIAEHIGYGGTLLYGLLQGIVHNFEPDNPEHQAVLDRLYTAEREALAGGELSSDFAFAVARQR